MITNTSFTTNRVGKLAKNVSSSKQKPKKIILKEIKPSKKGKTIKK